MEMHTKHMLPGNQLLTLNILSVTTDPQPVGVRVCVSGGEWAHLDTCLSACGSQRLIAGIFLNHSPATFEGRASH